MAERRAVLPIAGAAMGLVLAASLVCCAPGQVKCDPEDCGKYPCPPCSDLSQPRTRRTPVPVQPPESPAGRNEPAWLVRTSAAGE